jgi:hypothetical protein
LDKESFSEIEGAIDLAISLIEERGCDDVFRPPKFSASIEMNLIRSYVDDFRKFARARTLTFLKSGDIKGVGRPQKTFILKDHLNFRQISWIDPFDYVTYLTLALRFFPQIEKARLIKSTDIIHSSRKSDDEKQIFDKAYDFGSFRKKSGELTKKFTGKWKITADISNFFDRINLHSLENQLLEIGCEERLVRYLNTLLTHWTGSQRSFGIPVGSDASRILSEAMFIGIDRQLYEKGVCFVRYVDDFRIFAETREKAYSHLHLLTELLSDEGLFLNSQKTSLSQVTGKDEELVDQQNDRFPEHETIDTEQRDEVKVHLFGSGRVRISTFYREPGKDAVRELKKIKKEDLIREIVTSASDLHFEQMVKKSTKFFVYVDQDIEILKVLIDRKMSSLIYITDALSKEIEKLPRDKIASIKSLILGEFRWDDCPYPYKLPLLRLGTISGFEDSVFLRQLIETHGFMRDILFLREAIMIAHSQFDRPFLRKLSVDNFNSSPSFLQRAIFFALKKSTKISDEEKRPILKNMTNSTNDWFIQKMNSSNQL